MLSHTSDEPPGTTYRYDGNVFGRLTEVIEQAAGQPFPKVLTDRIIRPLGLTHTAPTPGDAHGFWSLVASMRSLPKTSRAVARPSARPASIALRSSQGWSKATHARGGARSGRPACSDRCDRCHTAISVSNRGAGGLRPDVARFSMALDEGRLLTERSKQRAWTAPSGGNGAPLPYSFGWFVQQYQSRRLVWHYGHALESSSLIVKVPEERVTFVVVANSDGLSRWRSLGDDADVTASPAAMLFLNCHVAQQGR